MSGQHTPGPWEARLVPVPTGTSWAIGSPVSGRNYTIATLYKHTRPAVENEANARLIAAAPALLKALEPELLEAVAAEIGGFEHSARAESLLGLARRQRAAIAATHPASLEAE